MGIAKDFNKVLHGQLRVHAAWLPVTNTFRVGDFGVISDGAFIPMGNIARDFAVSFQTQPGAEATLNFKSEQVREFRFAAAAAVTVFPDESVDARLKIEFGKERSFYLKAVLTVEAMSSVFAVAQQIARLHDWNEKKFKAVSATYSGTNCVVLSSREAHTSIEIGGKADALKRLEVGRAEAGLSYTSTSALGLEVMGGSGVVGLGLFSVRKKTGHPEMEALGDGVQLSESSGWPADLADDL